jgi:hypothetical protein
VLSKSCHQTTEVGGSTDEETKERVAKAGGEARAQDKEGCQKQGTRAERQFLKTKSICQRLARKANKSKN